MPCIKLTNLFMKEGNGMSKKSNDEALFLPTDDSVNVGKEPLPINDPKVEKLMKKSIERLKNL